MKLNYKWRRILVVLLALAGVGGWVAVNPQSYESELVPETVAADGEGAAAGTASAGADDNSPLATAVLERIETKGRAPKTGYTREQFYNGWPTVDGCSLRQRIIKRDFGETAVMDTDNPCNVIAGSYLEPYTGVWTTFAERSEISKQVQIDHIVALSDAWQKGAQNLDKDTRYAIATDPLNLIAADASANMTKGDGDAATWLPANKAFRCQYVARQIAVKYKYGLWVTPAEREAMERVLTPCPDERAVGVEL